MILQFEESRSAVTQILQFEEKNPKKRVLVLNVWIRSWLGVCGALFFSNHYIYWFDLKDT